MSTKNKVTLIYPTRAFTTPELLATRQNPSRLSHEHLQHLEEHGYCVIENVLSTETCEQVRADFYAFLIGLDTGLTLECLVKGDVKSTQLPYNLHGIVQYPRMVGPEVMRIRFDKEVNKVFADLWNVRGEDLITSEDRACYMPKVMDSGRTIEHVGIYKPWLHVDQPSVMPGLQCIQGLITVKNVSEQGGTLVVIPGSHKHHSALAKAAEEHLDSNGKGKKGKSASANRFVTIAEHLVKQLFDEHGLQPKAIRPLSAGSMVLWDSRTVHCNTQTLAEERMVVYTCQIPRTWAETTKGQQMKRRKEAFLGARNTSHWPHHVKVFPTKPHTYGGELRAYPKEYIEEKSVAQRHLKALEEILEQVLNDPIERSRLVRLAGFTSVEEYEREKSVGVKKRRIEKVEDTEEKPKKKARVKV